MTDEKRTGELLYIQTLQGFREKALPQLLTYLKDFGGFTTEIIEDDNNCDEMKAVTFRNPDYDTNFRLSEEFLSGLIFFANSIHHHMELDFETIEVQRGQVITVIVLEFRPKHPSEVF